MRIRTVGFFLLCGVPGLLLSLLKEPKVHGPHEALERWSQELGLMVVGSVCNPQASRCTINTDKGVFFGVDCSGDICEGGHR
jgi:hypothetical protein